MILGDIQIFVGSYDVAAGDDRGRRFGDFRRFSPAVAVLLSPDRVRASVSAGFDGLSLIIC